MRRGFEALMVGRVLAGRYEVLEAVARGGMSVVFRGMDRTLGREVAVKVVALAGVAPEDVLPVIRERFRREAASAARIQHACVVQVFDYGTDPELELDFIVMELLRGRDLKEALAAGPLPASEGLRILLDVARGVAAGHAAGLVHRDVKPANVFLLGEGGREGVKILDFGIAKPLEEDPDGGLTTTGTMPHSPAYASPEQLAAGGPVTFASDVYQLGLLAYEVLAGRRAYMPPERERIREGEPVPLAETEAWAAVPRPVREVVERAVRISPDERHPDAAAFADALARAAEAPEEAEDDGTLLAAPPPISADDTALLTAGAGIPAAPPPSPSARPEPGAPKAPPARRAIPRAPVLWAVPLLLLLAIAVWAARRGAAEPADAAAAALPDSAALAIADDEFLRMQGEVGEGEGPDPGVEAASAETPDPEDAAESEITAAVHDLNRAWVDGDIDRHVSHYAGRVDYYGSRNLPRSEVRQDRTRDMRRYDDRRIGIHDVDVELVGEDRARVLVDKQWHFGGEGPTREGRGVQEYGFVREGGQWRVVSERLLSEDS